MYKLMQIQNLDMKGLYEKISRIPIGYAPDNDFPNIAVKYVDI